MSGEFVLLAVVVVAVIAGGFFMLTGLRPDVSGAEARRLVSEGAGLIDVRTPEEFRAGHLPGAVNLPLDALVRSPEKAGETSRTLVLYCASGARSAQARRVLESRGYATVRNLGPMSAWGPR